MIGKMRHATRHLLNKTTIIYSYIITDYSLSGIVKV